MYVATTIELLIREQDNIEKLPPGTVLKIIAPEDAAIPLSLHRTLMASKAKEEYLASPGPITDRLWLGFMFGTLAAGPDTGYFLTDDDILPGCDVDGGKGKVTVVASLAEVTAPQKKARRPEGQRQRKKKKEETVPGQASFLDAGPAPEDAGQAHTAGLEAEPAAAGMNPPEDVDEERNQRFHETVRTLCPSCEPHWVKIMVSVEGADTVEDAAAMLGKMLPAEEYEAVRIEMEKHFAKLKGCFA